MKKIVTHDALFHLDDLCACAVLATILERNGESYQIIRTRDPEIIAEGDYVVDVGTVYDESSERFDHHQKEGAGTRANGIPYASIGLVWKKYGAAFCDSADIALRMDESLIQVLDADDTGIEVYKNVREDVEVVTIQDFFYAFRPTWKEDPADFNTSFMKLLPMVQQYLIRKVKRTVDKLEAQESVEAAYEQAYDKRLIVMDVAYPADEFLISKPEPLYKISPNAIGTAWGIKTINVSKDSFKNRKDLPGAWGGLRDAELQALTGVPDAIFCHTALFLATASSKEGALALAKLALDA